MWDSPISYFCRMLEMKDDNDEMPVDFDNEIHKWSLECKLITPSDYILTIIPCRHWTSIARRQTGLLGSKFVSRFRTAKNNRCCQVRFAEHSNFGVEISFLEVLSHVYLDQIREEHGLLYRVRCLKNCNFKMSLLIIMISESAWST